MYCLSKSLKILEKYFETEILREFKEDNTPVTLADRESEEIIKKIIFENLYLIASSNDIIRLKNIG